MTDGPSSRPWKRCDAANREPIYIVSACDQNYFPLLKGLYLSLIESGELADNIVLAMLDIGCSADALRWLKGQNIQVRALDPVVMGVLCDEKYGYRRGQTCRPFLPDLFPDASIIVWMDCDTWVQDVPGFLSILSKAVANPTKVLIAQEVHTAFLWPEFNFRQRIEEMEGYYKNLYSAAEVDRLKYYPTFNSGIFVLSRKHSLWSVWKEEIKRIYVDEFEDHTATTLHFGEQMALNYLIRKFDAAMSFDPLYNYLCNWHVPFRSDDGVVRSSVAPHLPLGVLHLGGGWKRRGKLYMESGILYRSGTYLDSADLLQLNYQGMPR